MLTCTGQVREAGQGLRKARRELGQPHRAQLQAPQLQGRGRPRGGSARGAGRPPEERPGRQVQRCAPLVPAAASSRCRCRSSPQTAGNSSSSDSSSPQTAAAAAAAAAAGTWLSPSSRSGARAADSMRQLSASWVSPASAVTTPLVLPTSCRVRHAAGRQAGGRMGGRAACVAAAGEPQTLCPLRPARPAASAACRQPAASQAQSLPCRHADPSAAGMAAPQADAAPRPAGTVGWLALRAGRQARQHMLSGMGHSCSTAYALVTGMARCARCAGGVPAAWVCLRRAMGSPRPPPARRGSPAAGPALDRSCRGYPGKAPRAGGSCASRPGRAAGNQGEGWTRGGMPVQNWEALTCMAYPPPCLPSCLPALPAPPGAAVALPAHGSRGR